MIMAYWGPGVCTLKRGYKKYKISGIKEVHYYGKLVRSQEKGAKREGPQKFSELQKYTLVSSLMIMIIP